MLKVGRRAEAIEHLRMAAYTKGHPNYWKALAFAAAESALECHALKHLLLLTVPHHDHDCWLRYLSLSFAYSDARGMIGVMEKCFSQEMNSSIHEMATEALIYVYGRIGAEDAAQSATIALINGRSPIQEGWRIPFENRFSLQSPELLLEEKRHANEKLVPKKTSAVPSGRIVAFNSQRFGFIEGQDRDTYFFRIDDIVDEALKQELVNGTWRKSGTVEFTPPFLLQGIDITVQRLFCHFSQSKFFCRKYSS